MVLLSQIPLCAALRALQGAARRLALRPVRRAAQPAARAPRTRMAGAGALVLAAGTLVLAGGPMALAAGVQAIAPASGALLDGVADDPLHRMTRTPEGLVHLRSVRPVALTPGSTVVVRWSVWNAGGATVMLAEDPCALAYDGSLRIEGVEQACSPGARTLAPGDSAWVELRGRVASPPGTHTVGSLLPGVGVGVTAPGAPGSPAAGPDPLRPPRRVPVVLELDDPRLDRDRVEALLQAAAGVEVVVLAAPEAARAQVETAPWLRLALLSGESGALEAHACWHRAGDGDAGCAPLRTRIAAAPSDQLLAPNGPLRRLAGTLLSLRDLAP